MRIAIELIPLTFKFMEIEECCTFHTHLAAQNIVSEQGRNLNKQ